MSGTTQCRQANTQYRQKSSESGHFKKADNNIALQTHNTENSKTNIPRKGNARPQSQLPHSWVCERFIYSHDRSAYSATGKYVAGII